MSNAFAWRDQPSQILPALKPHPMTRNQVSLDPNAKSNFLSVKHKKGRRNAVAVKVKS